MKVLIVENEIYLAQSISAKLSERGFACEIVATANEALREERFDVVLLSTNAAGAQLSAILQRHAGGIVILLVSYVSSDTVAKPLKAGAKDYILKPFMIDELLRKIEHYHMHERLTRISRSYERYIAFSLGEESARPDLRGTLPLLIKTNQQRLADQYALRYIQEKKAVFDFFCLEEGNWQARVAALPKDTILYMAQFQELKKPEKRDLVEALKGRSVILSSTNPDEEQPIRTLTLKSETKAFESSTILSVDDYIKMVVHANQDKYPDTELSKKLGMSRKSLWEKRKKYGIEKKK